MRLILQSRTVAFLEEFVLTLTIAHVQPLVALIARILILIMPRLLNYIVALYLIMVGIIGLNGIYHFMRCVPSPTTSSPRRTRTFALRTILPSATSEPHTG